MDTVEQVHEDDSANNVDSTIAYRVALSKINELQEQHILALASLHQAKQDLKNARKEFAKQKLELIEPSQQQRNEIEDLHRQLADLKESFLEEQERFVKELQGREVADDNGSDNTNNAGETGDATPEPTS